jgi:hypothetical protein
MVTDSTWTQLTASERTTILSALSSARSGGPDHVAEVDALIDKLTKAEPHPDITIGIYRGQVHWARGNPFPIRICDYDGFELPDVDERGKPCEIWWEPADDGVDDDV